MTTLEIAGKIPAKSSSRQVYLNKKTGRRFYASSDAYQQYEYDFMCQANIQKCVQLPVNKKGRLSARIIVCDNSRRQDIDSFPKTILDCLQKAEIILNDNKFDELYIIRGVDNEKPRCFIEITETSIDEIQKKVKRLIGF